MHKSSLPQPESTLDVWTSIFSILTNANIGWRILATEVHTWNEIKLEKNSRNQPFQMCWTTTSITHIKCNPAEWKSGVAVQQP